MAGGKVAAQGLPVVSPDSEGALSRLGYPELRITRTADGYDQPDR
jgi:hypothetical protein